MSNPETSSINAYRLDLGRSQNSIFSRRKILILLGILVRAFIIALIFVTVSSYIVLSPPVLTTICPALILCPHSADQGYDFSELNGIKREDVYFKNKSGKTLNAWFFKAKTANAKVLLFNHGNGGNIAYNLAGIQRLLNTGASVFIYDYQGYGKSEGKANVSGSLSDAEAAYDYLTKQRHVAPSDLILYGHSFGGSTACHIASSRPYAGMILESTFYSLIHTGRKTVGFFNMYPECLQPIPALDNASVTRAKHPPLLIIHGKQDPVIPYSEGEENYAVACQPKEFLCLAKSGHGIDDADTDLYQKKLNLFVARFNNTKK